MIGTGGGDWDGKALADRFVRRGETDSLDLTRTVIATILLQRAPARNTVSPKARVQS